MTYRTLTLTALALATVLGGCTDLPPPAEDNISGACRDFARIERASTATLTEQVNARIESRALGCPRFL